MEVKTKLRDPGYKDYMNIFPGPKFVSPEWRCPLNRGVPKERFHRNTQNDPVN